MTAPREYTKAMREISGFGGGYEAGCRAMVLAGCEWFDANPEADPQFHGYQGVYGIIIEDNEDAKALSKAVVDGANAFDPDGGVTGAMHQAAIQHVMAIRRMGWEKYVEVMSAPDEDEAADA